MASDDGLPGLLLAALNRGAVRLFRNQCGVARYGDAYVPYGLTPGSADLIGWRTTVITPDMVGKTLAIFVSIECKRRKRGVTQENQKKWAAAVTEAGGISAIVRTEEEAVEALSIDS